MAFGETVPADEAEKFRGFAEEVAEIQRERAAKRGNVSRVAHAKQHLGAVGELSVNAPEDARFGVFAEPGKRWPVYVRFSNGSGFHQSDKAPDARGFALKLVGGKSSSREWKTRSPRISCSSTRRRFLSPILMGS